MQEPVLPSETALHQTINDASEKIKGQAGRFIHMINHISYYTILKVAGPGSYIKTPENTSILNVDYLLSNMTMMSVLSIAQLITKLNKKTMMID